MLVSDNYLMGSTSSKVFDPLFEKKDLAFAFVGLDNAGKSTMLKQMNLGRIVQTMPDIGLIVESVKYRNIKRVFQRFILF